MPLENCLIAGADPGILISGDMKFFFSKAWRVAPIRPPGGQRQRPGGGRGGGGGEAHGSSWILVVLGVFIVNVFEISIRKKDRMNPYSVCIHDSILTNIHVYLFPTCTPQAIKCISATLDPHAQNFAYVRTLVCYRFIFPVNGHKSNSFLIDYNVKYIIFFGCASFVKIRFTLK